VRLDSGDLAIEATRARELLDSLGNTGTRVIVTSDLDEYAIAALAVAPVDGYGVGTSLVTGSGSPTVGMVYKLVERDGVPVAKNSEGKRSVGGRKSAVRELLVPLVRGGEVVDPRSPAQALAAAREVHERVRVTLPAEAWSLSRGEPAIDTVTA
jgi:nicotinate phosphoribosyltransferase